jgi:streptogramin lyase
LRRSFALIALIATIVILGTKLSAPVHAQQAAIVAAIHPQPIVIASGSQLSDIRGIAVDTAGNVYISSAMSPAPTACISRSVKASVSVTIFSNCKSAPAEDPSGVAVTSDGSRVFLANRQQGSIRLLEMRTGKVALLPLARSSAARAGDSAISAASHVTLAGPDGLAIDRIQNLFIADQGNNRVLALAPAAADFSGIAHILDAAAVATDSTGTKLYVASPASNRIYRIELSTGDLSAFAGTGALPETSAGFSTEFPAPIAATQAAIAAPDGIAVDAAENVFISDAGSNAILRVDAKTNLLTRVALNSALDSPGALAIDRHGDLFVADRGNHRIVEFAGIAAPQASGSVTLTPLSSDFGNQPTGGTTPQQTFVLSNGTSSTLSLTTSDFSFSGNNPNDFTQTNNCAGQLAAGASCQISVSFVPEGTGARSGSLMVTDSDASSPQTASLTGTGDTFNLTAANQNATMQTVVPGSPGNYSLSVTPDNVFGGTVALACPLEPPDPQRTITCSISPAQVTVTPGQAASFSVTLTTTNGTTTSTGALISFPPGPVLPDGLLMTFALLAYLLFLDLRAKKHRSPQREFSEIRPVFAKRRVIRVISAIAILIALGAAGCGGSASPTPPVTEPGIYKFNIVGTAQNASRAITLTLNVE